MKKIGILGGAFNPPHIGHLLIAEYVRDELILDEVWFVPTYESPHKENTTVSAKHRLAMLKCAIKDHPHFFIHTIEIDRKGKSYTIDTIRTFTKDFPTYEFFFIIGADMVEYLPNWKDVDELFELITFVGVKRHEFTLQTSYPILTVEIPKINISSTLVRERLKKNRSITYLVPNAVENYIKENHLYGH
ncbi:MAG TPA: nicotinate-nucleotide adenylyltransferase [Bacillota bacterium]|nr:nicotinate-nucleotide adenylyltransferase [Bacillota bacterium]